MGYWALSACTYRSEGSPNSENCPYALAFKYEHIRCFLIERYMDR